MKRFFPPLAVLAAILALSLWNARVMEGQTSHLRSQLLQVQKLAAAENWQGAEDALADALRAHRILGAGLDVFAQEPLPLDSPLIGLDNVILTPHESAQTIDALWNIYARAIEICSDFFAGKELARADCLNPDVNKTA